MKSNRKHCFFDLASWAAAGIGPAQGPGGRPPLTPPATSYYRLKLVRIVDPLGFGQPVEVSRLLLPADWRIDAGVSWDMQQLRCPSNIIQPYLRAVSHGLSGVQIAPGYSWRASNDPMTCQLAIAGAGCDMGPVVGAIDFLRQTVVTQTYQYQQAVKDRAAQQFSQTIRGVETYFNPRTCERVELVGGYRNAWTNNRGEYLVSKKPGFDPGVAFRDNWTPLRKGR